MNQGVDMGGIRIGLALVVLAAATPALAIDDPDQLVRGLYRLDTVPTGRKAIDLYFAADAARALKADYKAGEVGAVDFDYRYNGQDFEIDKLKIDKGVESAGESRVTATFTNFEKPMSVVYRLCIAKKGWRIADVSDGAGQWRLRKMLRLPDKVVC
jgi:hypothetical protein